MSYKVVFFGLFLNIIPEKIEKMASLFLIEKQTDLDANATNCI